MDRSLFVAGGVSVPQHLQGIPRILYQEEATDLLLAAGAEAPMGFIIRQNNQPDGWMHLQRPRQPARAQGQRPW